MSRQTPVGYVRSSFQGGDVRCFGIWDQPTILTRRSIRSTATGYLKAGSLWLNIHCFSTTSARTPKHPWISGRLISTFHCCKRSGKVPAVRQLEQHPQAALCLLQPVAQSFRQRGQTADAIFDFLYRTQHRAPIYRGDAATGPKAGPAARQARCARARTDGRTDGASLAWAADARQPQLKSMPVKTVLATAFSACGQVASLKFPVDDSQDEARPFAASCEQMPLG